MSAVYSVISNASGNIGGKSANPMKLSVGETIQYPTAGASNSRIFFIFRSSEYSMNV